MIYWNNQISLEGKSISAYSDGACSRNGTENAIGGWAFTFCADNEWYYKNGKVKNTTNQQMELMAAYQGCYILEKEKVSKIIIYTDSAYLCNCYSKKWYEKWLQNNWQNAHKDPIANRELWEQLIPYFKNGSCEFVKISGHSGTLGNELADQKAVEASRS